MKLEEEFKYFTPHHLTETLPIAAFISFFSLHCQMHNMDLFLWIFKEYFGMTSKLFRGSPIFFVRAIKGIQLLLTVGSASWRQSRHKIDYWESNMEMVWSAATLCRRRSFWKTIFGFFLFADFFFLLKIILVTFYWIPRCTLLFFPVCTSECSVNGRSRPVLIGLG